MDLLRPMERSRFTPMPRVIRNMRTTTQAIIIHIITRTAIVIGALTAILGFGGHHLPSIFAPSRRSDFAHSIIDSITSMALISGVLIGESMPLGQAGLAVATSVRALSRISRFVPPVPIRLSMLLLSAAGAKWVASVLEVRT